MVGRKWPHPKNRGSCVGYTPEKRQIPPRIWHFVYPRATHDAHSQSPIQILSLTGFARLWGPAPLCSF